MENIVNDAVVHYAASLARISLGKGEEKMFREQLSGILGYIEQLHEVNTDGVAPTTHVLPSMKNVFREDKQMPSVTTREALLNAPDATEEFFKVPRIIKGKTE
ncbi:MAG TPA: Asp-tRNA(Asn)/Glu-tRNA(Gln) amidotransferase subunit GatC [Candidatus Omnitrophota bacterium]|nr:Asp-tRNA(Asn)/Glu-tRNA(Gln) amidotransferase subunit GatC [Candidatus Omnitrophota bacterium]